MTIRVFLCQYETCLNKARDQKQKFAFCLRKNAFYTFTFYLCFVLEMLLVYSCGNAQVDYLISVNEPLQTRSEKKGI